MSFLLFVFLLLFPQKVLANSEFDVVQNISYTVNTQGTAKVVHEISLTNKISQIYAKEYQITIHNSDIQSVTGHDSLGNIIKNVENTIDKTTINLKFDNPTIGKDQTNKFYLNYSITKFAQKKGNTWEILFPQFDNQISDAKLNVTLNLPATFGDLSFGSIPIQSTHLVDNQNIIQFSPISSKNKILFVFGNNQIFDFKLLYYLQNSQATPQKLEIPIPPDTNIQTITYKDFQPVPENIRVDVDGNWLASFILTPKQELDVIITGQAKIHPSKKKLASPDRSSLTKEQKYWEVSSPEIAIMKNNLSSAKAIYDYVVSTLSYDYNQINFSKRKGALGAIQNPSQSLCTEFTDLFVTLARSANIPSREIEGYAYSNNPKIKPTNQGADILHAWPEYFDNTQNTWVQVDPTWEKTTNGIDYFHDLDLNHITFVIHGASSEIPPPPGSYKKNPTIKTVFVDFAAESQSTAAQNVSISIENNQLVLRNPNLFSIPTQSIKLNNPSWKFEAPIMPPLAKTIVDLPQISYLNSILPQYSTFKFEVSSPDSQFVKEIINRTHYLNLTIFIGSIVFVLCVGGIILTTSKKDEKNN